MGYGLDASTAKFELVTVLNLPMLFTCCRVDQDTVPEELYIYEVSHEEDVRGKPVQISERIRENLWGTLLTSKPIRLDKHPRTFRTYREIDSEVDWNYEGRTLTVNQYLDRYPPKKEKQKCHDR